MLWQPARNPLDICTDVMYTLTLVIPQRQKKIAGIGWKNVRGNSISQQYLAFTCSIIADVNVF